MVQVLIVVIAIWLVAAATWTVFIHWLS